MKIDDQAVVNGNGDWLLEGIQRVLPVTAPYHGDRTHHCARVTEPQRTQRTHNCREVVYVAVDLYFWHFASHFYKLEPPMPIFRGKGQSGICNCNA